MAEFSVDLYRREQKARKFGCIPPPYRTFAIKPSHPAVCAWFAMIARMVSYKYGLIVAMSAGSL